MSKLLYITNMSLDGYIEDANGSIGWANPDGVHEFVTDLLRPMRTYLYGRKLMETMAYWDAPDIEEYSPEFRDFAKIWQHADKIVFSRTLAVATTRSTRLERDFDPDAICNLKRKSNHDIEIGGASLAASAFDANLIDECHLFIHPVILGTGKPAFQTASRPRLELLEVGRFETGVIRLHYRVKHR